MLATFATTQLSTIVFAGTIDEDTSVEILKEVENEDGTLLVTIRDSQECILLNIICRMN